jgi:hypothetical protein
MLRKLKKRYVYRSSVTGEFVSRLYALMHPFTTIKEKVE